MREADAPQSLVVRFPLDRPLKMDAGVDVAPLTIAYQTYGTLNAQKSNAVLICHALSGDQHVASDHPVTGKPGWWLTMIGPGRPIDTDRYFVICSNVLGGCMGTTGPASLNPGGMQAWGLSLPVVTIRDMVRAQAMLIDHLGIDTLFCVAGGVTAYGVAYTFVHDIYIHRRVGVDVRDRPYLVWMRESHQLHHTLGGEPYGMLLPVVSAARRAEAARREARRASTRETRSRL